MYYVYALVDPRDNQPFYIGKGSGDRAKSHLYETYQNTGNRRKWCKIQSIRNGGQDPIIQIIKDGLAEDTAYDLETSLIKQYGRLDIDPEGILTNICEDNRPPSALGRIVSEETRQKHSERQRGERNHRYGKSWSDDQKELRRKFNLENGIRPPDATGRIHSEETKIKISLASKGKAKSEDHRQALSLAMKGKNKGPRSAQQKAKMSAWQQRTYHFTNSEGKMYTIKSAKLREFCKNFGMSYGGMMAAVKAERPYKGWMIKRL